MKVHAEFAELAEIGTMKHLLVVDRSCSMSKGRVVDGCLQIPFQVLAESD